MHGDGSGEGVVVFLILVGEVVLKTEEVDRETGVVRPAMIQFFKRKF